MSINFIQLVKGDLGSAAVSQAALELGESESSVSKAVSALLPIVLGGFANSNTPSELLSTVKEIKSAAAQSDLMQYLNGSDATISKILSLIFGEGDMLAAIINEVSAYAGIKSESTNSLLNLVSGAVAGRVGKYVVDNQLQVDTFANLLTDQKGYLPSSLPAGFSLSDLGLGNWLGSAGSDYVNVIPEPLQTPIGEVNPVTPVTENPAEKDFPIPASEVSNKEEVVTNESATDSVADSYGAGNIWKWLLPLLLLLLLGWLFWKQCDRKPNTNPADSTQVQGHSAQSNPDTVSAKGKP
ncbi:MAG: DUF937 domain-containing protein [Weeksellaceae bacterium]|nr:DUF937 domain-containing protein [Weeksellaceae bacterium]